MDEIVLVTKNGDETEIRVILRGFWVQIYLNIGENIRIFVPHAKWDEKLFVIDNDESFILIKPDQILTSTSISSGVFCRRKFDCFFFFF